MKLKLMPILAGAILLSVATTSLAVKAQQNTPQSQPMMDRSQGKWDKAGIELTSEQKEQMAEIQRQSRTEIEAILTPEQKQQFQAVQQNQQGWRQAKQAMNLSPEQQTQIKQIMRSSKERMKAVLTPEQQQQVEQYKQQRRLEQRNRTSAGPRG